MRRFSSEGKQDLPPLNLTDTALDQLASFRQFESSAMEAGGILLGRVYTQPNEAVVETISEPQRLDRRTRFSFFRSIEHNAIAGKYWRQTGGYGQLLGVWHSHPEDFPMPSQTDWVDWKRILRKSRYESAHLYFVIVGRLSLGVWVGTRQPFLGPMGTYSFAQLDSLKQK